MTSEPLSGEVIRPHDMDLSTVDPDDPEGIATNIVPYFFEDTLKNRYVGLVASGFGVREACGILGIAQRTVQRWKEYDPDFRTLVTAGLTALRDKVAISYHHVQFMRNQALWWEIDHRILSKAAQGKPISREERTTMLKRSTIYSPSGQVEITKLLNGDEGSNDGGFDFKSFILERFRDGTQRMEVTR